MAVEVIDVVELVVNVLVCVDVSALVDVLVSVDVSVLVWLLGQNGWVVL